jgi:cell division septation protein DedD
LIIFARCSAVVAAILGATLLAGCISSEGTSPGGKSKEGPQQSVGPIDTSKPKATQDVSVQKKATGTQSKRASRSTKFTAKHDTLKASLVRKTKPAQHPAKIERPANPMFTVQIGAFQLPKNALRNQKKAKERFPKYAVYNNFSSKAKYYRVSIGKFATRREASTMRQQILKKYPKDYSACWVNYIAK